MESVAATQEIDKFLSSWNNWSSNALKEVLQKNICDRGCDIFLVTLNLTCLLDVYVRGEVSVKMAHCWKICNSQFRDNKVAHYQVKISSNQKKKTLRLLIIDKWYIIWYIWYTIGVLSLIQSPFINVIYSCLSWKLTEQEWIWIPPLWKRFL